LDHPADAPSIEVNHPGVLPACNPVPPGELDHGDKFMKVFVHAVTLGGLLVWPIGELNGHAQTAAINDTNTVIVIPTQAPATTPQAMRPAMLPQNSRPA